MERRRSLISFAYALPVGVLAGLIGVGGAEFRLPVLVGLLGYPVRQAVPLNLAVSTITLAVALVVRSRALSWQPLAAFLPGVLALLAGSVTSAICGVRLARKLSDKMLGRIVRALLFLVGVALIYGAVSTHELPPSQPLSLPVEIIAGVCCGAAVGMISSLAGVAGGQLMIPVLMFVFALDIKTAGTASLLVNLPTVVVLVVRYARGGAYADRRALTGTVLPMSIGSCVGTLCGGLLVGIAPVQLLKIVLGTLLALSALRLRNKKG